MQARPGRPTHAIGTDPWVLRGIGEALIGGSSAMMQPGSIAEGVGAGRPGEMPLAAGQRGGVE